MSEDDPGPEPVEGAVYAVALSTTTRRVLYAVIATDERAWAIRADGSPHENQTRRLQTLFKIAKRKPQTADEWVRLAGVNLSAVHLGYARPASSPDDATSAAVAEMNAPNG